VLASFSASCSSFRKAQTSTTAFAGRPDATASAASTDTLAGTEGEAVSSTSNTVTTSINVSSATYTSTSTTVSCDGQPSAEPTQNTPTQPTLSPEAIAGIGVTAGILFCLVVVLTFRLARELNIKIRVRRTTSSQRDRAVRTKHGVEPPVQSAARNPTKLQQQYRSYRGADMTTVAITRQAIGSAHSRI
jgi:hypothetical protein